VLVTGATGFVGYAVADRLRHDGQQDAAQGEAGRAHEQDALGHLEDDLQQHVEKEGHGMGAHEADQDAHGGPEGRSREHLERGHEIAQGHGGEAAGEEEEEEDRDHHDQHDRAQPGAGDAAAGDEEGGADGHRYHHGDGAEEGRGQPESPCEVGVGALGVRGPRTRARPGRWPSM
jgi:hypothetical protein